MSDESTERIAAAGLTLLFGERTKRPVRLFSWFG
jgi:hypothetical protein